jgi:SEL1 protein
MSHRCNNVVVLLLLLYISAHVLLTSSTASKKKGEESNDDALLETAEDNFVMLNDDGEVESKQIYREVSEITDDDIDRMEHSKQSPASSVDPSVVAFEEFVPEKPRPGRSDERSEQLYFNALEVLQKRRWSGIDYRDIRAAYYDLEEAARLGHADATKILAYSYLFGDFRWSIDEAKKMFEKLAESGSADGHLGLGFLYSTGAGLSKPEPARGYLHYSFAALGGSPLAQMALGYRFGYGVSAVQNCEKALSWYQKVAEKVASKVKLTGAPAMQRIRIPDEIVREKSN